MSSDQTMVMSTIGPRPFILPDTGRRHLDTDAAVTARLAATLRRYFAAADDRDKSIHRAKLGHLAGLLRQVIVKKSG